MDLKDDEEDEDDGGEEGNGVALSGNGSQFKGYSNNCGNYGSLCTGAYADTMVDSTCIVYLFNK